MKVTLLRGIAMAAGLSALCGFQFLGEMVTELVAPAVPGAVAGLLLLLLTLGATGYTPSWLSSTSYRLISLMSLFFLPAGVGVFFLGDIFQDHWPAIVAAILLATPLSIALTAILMRFFLQRLDRRGD